LKENRLTQYSTFDAFVNEAEQRAPNGFQLGDEKFTLPVSLPAKLVLKSMRLGKGDVSQDKVIGFFDEFFTLMLGAADYERLLDTGISFQALQKLIEWIVTQYNPDAEQSAARGNARKNA
jgi:hypothetical protein